MNIEEKPMDVEHFETGSGKPDSYSQAVRWGDMIYTSGQLGADPGGPEVSFAEQAEIALRRMVAAVEAAGGSLETILKINGYLTTLDDFPAYDAVYRKVIAVHPKPARTTIENGGFIAPCRVEVDAVAVARNRAPHPGERE
jgi:2-iminobutanoate/2-iminopropanoate deaminase